MSKQATKTELEVISDSPAFLQEYAGQYAGKGMSFEQEDRLVPFIKLLQGLSPEITKGHEKYIKGAEAGDFAFPNCIPPLVKGEEGIIVQPCAHSHAWVEWTEEGAFVTRHNKPPADTKEIPNPEDSLRKILVRNSNNNVIVETRYQYIRYNGRPYAIPFKSTGHQVWKSWNEMIIALSEKDGSFSRLWKLTPKLRTKGNKSWYVYTFEDAGWVHSKAEYLAGAEFCKSIESGLKVAAEEESDTSARADENIPF